MTPAKRITRAPLVALGLLMSILYASVAAGQVLGMLRIYDPLPVNLFTLGTLILVAWAYFKYSPSAFFESFTVTEDIDRRKVALDWILYGSGGILLIFVFIVPLIRWPYAYINQIDFWDAAAYHLPKAIELFRSGSAWDLSIPYGQYPLGFESLLAHGLILTGNESLFGLIHALIALYLVFALWLLARRITRLPYSLLFFFISLLLASGRLVQAGNPWWFLGYLLFSVGMNDVFLAASLLTAILHAPVAFDESRSSFHPVGLAMASMLALGTKPNSALVLILLWGLTIFAVWRSSKSVRERNDGRLLFVSAILVIPGALWALRNLIIMKTLFTPGAMLLQEFSISSNLTNPYFYRHIPRNLLGVTGILLAATIGSFWKRIPRWSFTGTFLVLMISFALTPVSGFFYSTEVPAQISWRLGLALLGFSFLALLGLVRPVLRRLYQATIEIRSLRATIVAAILVSTCLIIWQERDLFQNHPENDRLLRDQFQQNVGVDGYASAYDYVHKNIRHAAIQVVNGLPYYVYGPGFTNSPTTLEYPVGSPSLVPQIEPDYYLIFGTEWWGGDGAFPDHLDQPDFLETWSLIYQDEDGRLYQLR